MYRKVIMLLLMLFISIYAMADSWYVTGSGDGSTIAYSYTVPEDCELTHLYTTSPNTPSQSTGVYSAGISFNGELYSELGNTNQCYCPIDYASSTIVSYRSATIYNSIPLKKGDVIKVTYNKSSWWTTIIGLHKDDAIRNRR